LKLRVWYLPKSLEYFNRELCFIKYADFSCVGYLCLTRLEKLLEAGRTDIFLASNLHESKKYLLLIWNGADSKSVLLYFPKYRRPIIDNKFVSFMQEKDPHSIQNFWEKLEGVSYILGSIIIGKNTISVLSMLAPGHSTRKLQRSQRRPWHRRWPTEDDVLTVSTFVNDNNDFWQSRRKISGRRECKRWKRNCKSLH